MEEIVSYAKQLTITTLWAAVMSVIVIVGVLAKLFKDWNEVVQGVKRAMKGVGVFSRAVFKMFIWRQDMERSIKRMEVMIGQVNERSALIEKEVKINGGSSVKDGVLMTNMQIAEVRKEMASLSARLQISALAMERMEFRMNAEGAWLEANEIFLRKFGWHQNDVTGFAYENMIDPADLPELTGKIRRAVEQCSRLVDELRMKDSRGEWCRVRLQAQPICNGNQLVEFAGLIQILKQE